MPAEFTPLHGDVAARNNALTTPLRPPGAGMTGLDVGIHPGVPEADYHADPAITPSASSGILRTLLYRSPEHARVRHPRLNEGAPPSPATDAMNRGTILHALLLETEAPFRVLDVADFKKKEAQALRDETLAAGLIPVKRLDMEELQDAAASIRARLAAMPEVWAAMQDAIGAGMTETTLIHRERGVLCRVRYDTLPAPRFRATYDLKFTGVSAEPEAFGRKVTGDYSFQADLYPRAVRALRGDDPLFVFVAAETEMPFGVTLHALDPEAAELARERVDAALDRWSECLRSGVWPLYPTLVHYHGCKPWEVAEWAERRASAHQARQIERKPSEAEMHRVNDMQRAAWGVH